MPPTPKKTTELNQENIAIALLKGGLSWEETVNVIKNIVFDTSNWDGSKIINIKL
jgi:hypothetical protein